LPEIEPFPDIPNSDDRQPHGIQEVTERPPSDTLDLPRPVMVTLVSSSRADTLAWQLHGLSVK
jgi:hypothetical protein